MLLGTEFNNIFPPLIKPRFTSAMIAARKLLHEMGNPLPPIQLHEFAEIKGWKVVYDDLMGPDGYMMKVTKKKGDRFAIFIATDMDRSTYAETQIERRQYWTIAHEIGHILLHSNRGLNTSKDLNNVDKETAAIMEVEANWFAGALLMPDYAFKEFKDIIPEFLMEKCRVNFTAAQKRLKNLDNSIKEKLILDGQKNNIVLFPDDPSVEDEKQLFGFYDEDTDDEKPIPLEPRVMPMTKVRYYTLPQINGRTDYCPHCQNSEFSENANYCKMCGFHLYNSCSNDECQRDANVEARYCETCGHKTTFLLNDILTTWEELKKWQNENKEKEKLLKKTLDISDDDLPF